MGEAKVTKKILIVDDEPTILLTLSYALRSKSVEVITASRLEPAEEALKKQVIDLVIADIRKKQANRAVDHPGIAPRLFVATIDSTFPK